MTCTRFAALAVCLVLLSCQVAHAGLIGHWKFDEAAAATSAVDSSGEGNDGAITDATLDQPGLLGRAYEFNGSTSFVDPGSGVVDGVASFPFSIAAWIKTTGDSGARAAVWTGKADDQSFYYAGMGNNRAVGHARNGGAQITLTGPVVNDGQWHHVAAVFISNTSRRLFVDGGIVSSNTSNQAFIGGLTRFNIGRNGRPSATDYFDGLIDDVGIWDTELTPTNVQTIYDNGLQGLDLAGNPVPEPASLALTLMSALAILAVRRRAS